MRRGSCHLSEDLRVSDRLGDDEDGPDRQSVTRIAAPSEDAAREVTSGGPRRGLGRVPPVAKRRTSMPYPHVVLRNRVRSGLGLIAFIGFFALTVWAIATSPFDTADTAIDVCFFLPILVLLFRFTTECAVADPQTDEIGVRNLFRTRRISWSEIDRFEVRDQNVGRIIRTQVVVCVRKDAQQIRVQGAGRWVRQAGYGGVSLTAKKTLSLFSQELNIRRHQHEFGLPLDQLPQPW
jgi:hypothetical protein